MLKFHAIPIVLLLAFAACHRAEERRASYVQSLRCGMSRAEVTQLAHEHGYGDSDRNWLTRMLSRQPEKSKALTLVDLTFRGGRLVAYREGTWNPRTKHVDYRTVDLCSGGQ